ncbi:MAG TPA: acyl-CoA dehydrogenase family protein [Dehalococcoidia bacterium]|nr:acyl-CoA dehydrogenase family protein [Dehalococcoidia bacterium]
MRFEDSETQKLLRTTVRSFLADRFPWERLYAIEAAEGDLAPEDLKSFAELGWLGLLAPAAAGGAALSLTEAAVVVDEFGYAGAPSSIAVSNIVADALGRLGDTEARDHLGLLTQGKAQYTLASGSLAVKASHLLGTLQVVPYGNTADHVLTALDIDGEAGIGLVRADAGGAAPLHALDHRSYADLDFEGATTADVLVLATGDEARAASERRRILVAGFSVVEMAGLLARIKDLTGEYISNRVQFGQPIAKFQAARHHAADLLTAAETTRWAIYHALWQLDRDPRDSAGIWLARHWAIRAARQAVELTHLLHGGVGVGMEYPLHLLTQSLASLAVRGGTLDEATARTLASLGFAPATGSA